MADTFNVAPGVYFSERDASLATRSALFATAGCVSRFQWGPVEQVVQITGGEPEVVNTFYKPSAGADGIDQLVLHDYLTYSRSASVVRAFSIGATNAVVSGETNPVIKNDAELENYAGSLEMFGRYLGSLGNNLNIIVIDEAQRASLKSDYDLGFRDGLVALWPRISDKSPLGVTERHVLVTDATGAISGDIVSAPLAHKTLLVDLEVIEPADGYKIQLGTSTTFPIVIEWTGAGAPADVDEFLDQVVTKFKNEVSGTEKNRNGIRAIKRSTAGTLTVELTKAAAAGSWWADPNDSLSIETEDEVTLTATGSILELFLRTSTVEGSINENTGLPNHFTETVNKNSKYVGLGSTWTATAGTFRLQGAVDGSATNVDYYTGQQLLQDSRYRVLGLIDVCGSINDSQALVDVAVSRRDCVSFVGPTNELRTYSDPTRKFTWLQEWRENLLRDNSYMFITDNWARIYDEYNKVDRWIPTTGGTCGVWFRSIANAGSGKSPGFLNRGRYKNYQKLDWSASDDQVAVLYNDFQINSIREMDEGIILWGDRTGLSKDSSFNRIGTRGVFIDCEVAIAKTARYTLGEDNDRFTRKVFKNSVEPFLRSKKDRNEIEDYFVKADETNNTGQVIVSNQFVSGVYIKPKYSINYVYLDFVSVRPDVSFSEVEVGASVA